MGKKRILIIDDSRDLTLLLETLLKRNHYEVDIAYDGRDGINKSESNPDLILLDRSLPDIEGLEVCRIIRKNTSLKYVSIIFLTGHDTAQDIEDGLYIGVDDYITKPFNNKELLARIEAAIKRKQHFEKTVNNQQVIITELLQIIHQEKVASFYQPIFSTNNSDTLGLEALSRSPVNNILNSSEILFEASLSSNMYNELESLCWRKAISRWKDFDSQGRLFLNCLPRFIESDLANNQFFDNVGVSLKNIVIEINEQTVPTINEDIFIEKLDNLKQMGTKIAIDNFGNGLLTINTVLDMHPNYLKIDISLLRNINSYDYKKNLLAATVKVCHDQNIEVIIKGATYHDDVSFAEDSGVDYIQGNLLCSPKQKIMHCKSLCKNKNQCEYN